MNIFLAGKRIALKPTQSIGKGGEADVFDLGNGQALKLFKPPDHPDYQGLPHEQAAAKARIVEHQQKLRRFPAGLPAAVVAPKELATDQSGRTILGYAMQKIADAEPLYRLADPVFRRAGYPAKDVVNLFAQLHTTVDRLHQQGVVIGDFNDRNVLVKGADGYLIDADSFQFERFLCGVFTDRFVDPLLCKAVAGGLAQAKPHSADSDWYAYAVLLMQSLLFVGPYGGIYRPKDSARRLVQSVRPLHRITVFNPEVQYPKPASSLSTLPEDLLEVFHRIFEKDERAAFPMARLQSLQFTRCASCSTEHARIACPVCSPSAALRTKIALRVRGQVTCKPLFETSGLILEATTDRDELGVVLHESDAFRREDGTVLFRGPLDRRLRFAISGKDTLVGKAGEMVVLSPNQPPAKQQVDSDGRFGAFTASASRRFWIQDGRLMRFTPLSGVFGAPEQVGEVLANQTRFWVGRTFGLGLYRAGALSVGFVFDLDKLGINDQLKLPRLPGELLEADCTLSESRAWLRLALQTGGQTRHLCLAWSRTGQLEGLAEASAGDGTWLGAMGGAVAVGGMLLVATDAGIARVELKNGAMEKTTDFPDTEPFVSSDCRLLVSKDGLLVVGAHQINALHLP